MQVLLRTVGPETATKLQVMLRSATANPWRIDPALSETLAVMVAEMKAAGHPPERVIIGLRALCNDLSYRQTSGSAEPPDRKDVEALLSRLVTAAIKCYYLDGSGVKSGAGNGIRNGVAR